MGLSFPRILVIFWVLPFLSESIFQGMVRNVFAFCMIMVVFPLVKASVPPEGVSITIGFMLLIKEVFIGLAIGFIVALPFWAAASMGFMIDTQRGAFVATLFSPFFGSRVSPLGTLLLQSLAVLFFISGGFLIMLKGIYQSYIFWPPLDFFPRLDLSATKYFVAQFQWHIYVAVLLAAPISILLFVIDFSMGMINRFVPQLNVFFLSLPIKGVTAIFLLAVYFVTLTGYFESHFNKLFESFYELDGLLG